MKKRSKVACSNCAILFLLVLDKIIRIGFNNVCYHSKCRNYMAATLSGDKTGKLMKYEPQINQVTVLLSNLTFANGVALSKDGSHILVVEINNCRVLRYWLKSPKAGTLEVFANLTDFGDNIKRSLRGGYWVGIHSRRNRFVQWIMS